MFKPSIHRTKASGFTLLEILLVIGIISILAGITIIAINPARQLAQVRNTERKSDIKQIFNALNQYYIDHNNYPLVLSNTAQEICASGNATSSPNCDDLLDLSILVPLYLTSIPTDPKADTGTDYKVALDSTGKLYITAMQAELNTTIEIGGGFGVIGKNWDVPADWTPAVTTGTLRYWIADSTGNWNDTANWSTTSGGTGGASVPGSTNDAIFDDEASGDVIVNANVNVKGLIFSGYQGTFTQNAYTITIGADGYSQASGSFAGSASAITINGPWSLYGGEFVSTSGLLTMTNTAGNFTIFSGNFIHNNGTLQFNGFSQCILTTNGSVFYNINFYSYGAPRNGTSLLDDFTVEGDINFGNYGYINIPSGTVTVDLKGDIYAGQAGYGLTQTGSGTFIVNLTGDSQTITSYTNHQISFYVNLKGTGTNKIYMEDFVNPNRYYAGFLNIDKVSGVVDLMSSIQFANLTINSGNTLNANNNYVYIYNDFTNYGTLNSGESTFVFPNGSRIANDFLDNFITGGAEFNNVIFSESSRIVLHDDLTILGDLTISTYGRVLPSGTRNIYLSGNFIDNSIVYASNSFGTSDLTLRMVGSSEQTLSLTNIPFYSNLVIAKSSGVALLNSNFNVRSPAIITINTGNTFNLMGHTLTGTLVNNGTIIP